MIAGASEEAVEAARRRLAPAAPAPPARLVPLAARRGERVVIVAGPGVLAAGATRGVVALAGITGATVVNTVGAKGLLQWDDPLHGGTIGLQEDDAHLCEVDTADLVVTTGLDPAESASLTAALARRASARPDDTVDVHPTHLALAAGGWPPADRPGDRPRFYAHVAAVVSLFYDGAPTPDGRIAPPRAARALATDGPAGGLVVAPPGPTGFWIGRTFPTSATGTVAIPTGDPPGTAAALAVLAARTGRPVTLVVADQPDEGDVALLAALAGAEDLQLTVEVWSDGPVDERPGVRGIGIDWSALDALVAAVGPPDPAIWPGH